MKTSVNIQRYVSKEFTEATSINMEYLDIKTLSEAAKSDFQIEQAVLNEFKRNTSVEKDKIRIKVKNGIITLNGKMNFGFHRLTVIRNEIKNLAGVKGIINNMKVIPELTDKEINPKL